MLLSTGVGTNTDTDMGLGDNTCVDTGAATGVVKICKGHTAWCKGSANCLNEPRKVQSVIFYFFFDGVSSECLTSWL